MRRTGKIGIAGALFLLLLCAGAPTTQAAEAMVPAGRERMAPEGLPLTGEGLLDSLTPDAILEVRESAFNRAAATIEPVRKTGHYKFTVDLRLGTVTVCDSDWTTDVSGITLGIAPGRVSVRAKARAHWCDQAFTADIDTTGDIVYDPARRHFLITINPTSVTPRLVVTFMDWKFEVPLPFTINLAQITAPPIPVRSFFFTYETSKGSGTLHGTPRDVALVKRQGYIELQSNLRLW